MTDWILERVLKRDVFGRVDLLTANDCRLVRRVACGSAVPGSRLVARLLLARERRALQVLHGLSFVPELRDDAMAELGEGTAAGRRCALLRSWLDGVPLWATETLPTDFFDLLRMRVAQLHERAVCHNDLHKENNVLVGTDGRPLLVDFQLASVHARRGA